MDASAVALVLRWAGEVHDPRRHNRVHPLPEMIVMALLAILCGSDGWDDVAEFCQIRRDWLATFLPRARGVPSHDTFDRVFSRLDPLHLERMLHAWMNALHAASAGKLLAIDGKSLRRSFEHAWDKSGMAHIVSVFATQNGLVLGQLGVEDAENELTAIKQLLPTIDLRGSTVTIDALGCQREIAGQIKSGGGDYVLCVKNNQPELLAKVKTLMDCAILEKMEDWRGSRSQETNGGHGRIETRSVWYTTEVEHLGTELLGQWPGLKAIAAVERKRQMIGQERKKEASIERHYYILSSDQLSAEPVGRIIRGHWGIENGLHYVLDVSFDEDRSRVRKGHGAENLSRLRRLTANLLKRNGSKRSIKGQRKTCGWSPQYLFQTLFRGLETATP
jgi:predicted transposase YbfD/YdcC